MGIRFTAMARVVSMGPSPVVRKLLSVVTPCYNEEASIVHCYETVRDILTQELPEYDYEHIIADNASTDGTLALLRDIAGRDRRVKVIANARNFGPMRSHFNALLAASGGRIDSYDTSWIDDDTELTRVAADPAEAVRVAAGFAMVVSDGRRDRLQRMLSAGLRVPPVLTGCQTYLLTHADMLRTLLAHGMSPDLMNWQRQTLLHHVCRQPQTKRWILAGASAAIERATILLDAGANILARDEEYRSTPLAWAARSGAVAMVKFLLSRGAPTALPDDEPWTTPLAWAERRQHAEIASVLRQHGADR